MNAKLASEDVGRMQHASRGLFYLSIENLDVNAQLLMSSPHKFDLGICDMQQWVPRFNPNTPKSLRITLKMMPLEYRLNAMQLVDQLGQIIGFDTNNDFAQSSRFCIALDLSKGYATSIEIECNKEGPLDMVLVDYEHLQCGATFVYH